MARRKRPRAILFESLEPRRVLNSDSDLLVNVLTPRTQTSNIVGTALDINDRGDAVVVFSGKGPQDDKAVFFRRFPNPASGLGGTSDVIQVNQTIREDQIDPTVAVDQLGNFVVTWFGRGRDPRGISDQLGIFARWYHADGTPKTAERLVNTTIGGVQKQPDVAVTSNGRAIVVWSGAGEDDPDGIYFQLYDQNGTSVGLQRRVNIITNHEQAYPSVAIQDDGSFIVSWSSRHQDGSGWGIYYRLFHADGSSKSGELRASVSSISSQFRSRVGMDASGNFALAWAGYSQQSSWDIFHRRFDAQGQPRSDELRVNSDSQGHQQDVDLAMAPDGRYVISWSSGQPNATGSQAGSGWEVFAKLYRADGEVEIEDTLISSSNGSNSGHQEFVAVAIGAGPEFLASWSGRGDIDRGGVWFRPSSSSTIPTIDPIRITVTPEMQWLSLPIVVRSSDPNQRIGLRLKPTEHPAGMMVDPNQARVLWNPSETQGPATYYATIIAYDLANPERSSSQRIRIDVTENNQAPKLASVPNAIIDEHQVYTVQLAAIDNDRPFNRLRYSLLSKPDATMTIDPTTGLVSWMPNEVYGGQSVSVVAQVLDDGSPAMSDTVSWTIQVREFDQAPELSGPIDRTILELDRYSLLPIAQDPDDINPVWEYSLVGARPSGLQFDSTTGQIDWTPSESQGPNVYPLALRVVNKTQPNKSATTSFTLTVREVNQAPNLLPIPDQTASVGQVISLTALATDNDLPANRLRFSLVENSIANAAIDPTSGIFQWQTTTVGVYRFTVQVADDGSPSLFDRESFSVIVGNTIRPPSLRPIPDQSIDEHQLLSFQVQADPSTNQQSIRFRLLDAPSGMTIDETTGQVRWTPSESQAPSMHSARVQAFDLQRPQLLDEALIRITAREVNDAPQLSSIPPISVMETQSISVNLQATDADLPRNQLRYSVLGNAPTGLQLSLDGKLTWTTTEADGPGVYPIVVRVSDDGVPNLFDIENLTITVSESNSPPQLQPIDNVSIDEMKTWRFDLRATDRDLPHQAIQFSLDAGSLAAGIMVDSITGQLSWTPTEEQGPSNRRVTVTATDTGLPPLSSSYTFDITVREINRPPKLRPILARQVTPGQSIQIPLDADDPDIPEQNLVFSITSALPSGASFDASTRILQWNVPTTTPPGTQLFRASVVDRGSPALRDEQEFSIEVLDPVIEIVEEHRFLTAYEQTIVIPSNTRSLRWNLRDISFDRSSFGSIGDALEFALLDTFDQPVVGIIAPNRDAFFNWTEDQSVRLGPGAKFHESTGDLEVDVRHLTAGKSVRWIARLLNNDGDNQTRAHLSTLVTAQPIGISSNLTTPPEPAFRTYPSQPLDANLLKHLQEFTNVIHFDYGLTTYDADTQVLSSIVTLTNVGNQPLRGPLLIAITDFPKLDVQVESPSNFLPLNPTSFRTGTSASLFGAPFLDLSPLLSNPAASPLSVDGTLSSFDSLTFQILFRNATNDRFPFKLRAMAMANQGPRFESNPDTDAMVGQDYRYPAMASDPENDERSFSLLSGPAGMTIHPQTGELMWKPELQHQGSHRVAILVADPFGEFDRQEFSIEVQSDTLLNRPPRITSSPIVDAYVGELYQYPVTAIDPDHDRLQFFLEVGVGDLNSTSGKLHWIPRSEHTGRLLPVTIRVEDGRGGFAKQEYRIFVHPNRDNLPPVFVTTPTTEMRLPWVPSDSSFGLVEPKNLVEFLPRGMTVDRTISLIPPDDLQLPTADIVLVVDESGSMQEQSWIAGLIESLDDDLQLRGIGQNRFAIVGYGGLQLPRLVTETAPYSMLLFGPNGELLEQRTIRDSDSNWSFAPSMAGAHTLIVAADPSLMRSPEPPDSLFYNFTISSQTASTGRRVGLGIREGRLDDTGKRELTFQAPSGTILYLDGLAGSGTSMELLDIQGNTILSDRPLLSDSSTFVSPSSEPLRLRLHGDALTPFRLNILDVQRDGIGLSTTELTEGTLQDSESIDIFHLDAERGSILFVDRRFSPNEDDFGFDIHEAYTIDMVLPDGSLIRSASSEDLRPFEVQSLDMPPQRVLQSGRYSFIVRKGPDASNTPIDYRFQVGELHHSVTASTPNQWLLSASTKVHSTEIYSFELNANDRANLEVAQLSGGSASYRWLDSHGLPIHSGTLTTGTSLQNFDVHRSGTYYLMIEAAAFNSYPLQYSFRLRSESGPASSPLARNPLPLGELLEGRVNSSALRPNYTIAAEAGERLAWTGWVSQGSIRITTPSGGTLWSQSIDIGTSANQDPSPTILTFPETGLYRVEFLGSDSLNYAIQAIEADSTSTRFDENVSGTLDPSISIRSFSWNAERGQEFNFRFPELDEAFGSAPLAVNRAYTLAAAGNTEDGYQALDFALDQLDFRERVSKHIIFLSDEDRDVVSSDTFDALFARLSATDIGFHTIVQADFALDERTSLLGVAPSNTRYRGFQDNGRGGFVRIDGEDLLITEAEGTTEQDYIDLSLDLGGSAWGISKLRSSSDPETRERIRQSLTSAFVDELATRIDRQAEIALRVPDQVSEKEIAKIGSPQWENGRLQFPVTLQGDGDVWNFDFEFYNRHSPNVVYGVVPAAIATGYRYDFQAVDPDIDPIEYSLTQAPNAELDFSSIDRTLLWAPKFPGDYRFELKASDNYGGTDRQTWQVRVLEPSLTNRPPLFDALPTIVQPALRPLQFHLPFSDPDSDSLTFQLLSNPTTGQSPPLGMTLDPENGRLDWIPQRQDIGVHRVFVRAVDGRGGSRSAEIRIEVTPPTAPSNRRPIIHSNPTDKVSANQTYRYSIIATDPDLDPLKYTIAIGPQGISIDRETGELAWNTTSQDVGPHDMIVRVTDAEGATTLQAFQVMVTPSIPITIVSQPPLQVERQSLYRYDVAAQSGIPSDQINYEIVSGPAGSQMDRLSGKLTWPTAEAQSVSFEIRAVSSNGEYDTQRFQLRVIDSRQNHPPSIDGTPRTSIPHSRIFAWQVPAFDLDQDKLKYELLVHPVGSSLDRDSGLLLWTPTREQQTVPTRPPHEFVIKVDDGRGGTITQRFWIAVDNSLDNAPPEIAGDPLLSSVANRPYQTRLTASDPDRDLLIWTLVEAPESMEIDSSGLIQWNPSIDDVGKRTVSARVQDIYGAYDQTTWTIDVRGANSPPQISGNPLPKHRRGTLYQASFAAADEQGDVPTFKIRKGPMDASIDPQTGELSWLPNLNGVYVFEVSAEDTFGDGSSMTFEVTVDEQGMNRPPRFESTSVGVATAGQIYRKKFTAVDPDGDSIEYRISDSPASMSIDSNGNVQWTPLVSQIGQIVSATIEARDPLGLSAKYRIQLPVRAANRAPVWTTTPPSTIIAGQWYKVPLMADDADLDPLEYRLISGPAGSVYDSETQSVRWLSSISSIGSVPWIVDVTDNRMDSPLELKWTLAIVPDTTRPELEVSISASMIEIGQDVTIAIDATDDVGIVRQRIQVGDVLLPIDAQGRAKFTPDQPGRYELIVNVADAAGNEQVQSKTVVVRDPNNAAPRVAILSPNSSAPLVVASDVLVDVRDDDSDLVRVALDIRPIGDGHDRSPWLSLGSLSAEVGEHLENLVNVKLAQIDTTNLANGAYLLRLTAEDAGFNQVESYQPIVVASRLKLGEFEFEVSDLTIPVTGIPVSIRRSYSSLNNDRQSDFGMGWALEFDRAKLRVVDETLGPLGSGRYRGFVDGTRVLVELPDGRREGFTFRAQPGTQAFGIVFDWRPGFEPDAANQTQLEIDSIVLTKLNDEYQTGEGITYNPADPKIGSVYRLKTLDRMTQFIPALVGETTRISDRNGNELTFGEDGVVSNRGRGVQFERDYRGRIIRIVDPRGNSLKYEYDDVGHLIAAVDREGNTTRMSYGLDHRLESIIDPFGVKALKVKYDPRTNRLTALEDAIGQQTKFTYDLLSLSKTSVADSGSTESVRMDWDGNELEELDNRGNRIIREYGHGKSSLPTVERTVIGELDQGNDGDDLVIRRTFNSLGQMVTETDFRGNVTRHIYTADGAYYGTVHPTGVTEYFQYDSKENLVMTGSSAGATERISYDANGNVIRMIKGIPPNNSGDFGGHGGHNNSNNTNPSHATYTFEYNIMGDLMSTIDANGQEKRFHYDANGNETSYTTFWKNPDNPSDVREVVERSEIDKNDNTFSTISPTGSMQMEIDAFARVTRSIDEQGLTVENLYDIRGLLIQTRSSTFVSTTAGTLETKFLVARNFYDAQGRRLYSTSAVPEGTDTDKLVGTRFIYDASGRTIGTESRRGIVIAITLAEGIPTSTLVSEGVLIDASRSEFDSQGRLARSWDSFGTVTEYFYDRWQQVIESRTLAIDATGEKVWRVSRIVYDSLGRQILTTDPYLMPYTSLLGTGNSPEILSTRSHYDEAGRIYRSSRLQRVVIAIANGSSSIVNAGFVFSKTETIFDDIGRPKTQISADGQREDIEYDQKGRVIAKIAHRQSAESVSLQNLYPGLWIRHRMEYQYNSIGRLQKTIDGIVQIEDGDGSIVKLDRAFARMTAYEEDEFGNKTRTTLPDGSTRKVKYDTNGRTLEETNELGQVVRYQYDPAGRLSVVSVPDVMATGANSSVRPRWQYTYDTFGNLASVRDNIAELPSGQVLMDHDGVSGDDSRLTRFSYSLDGKLLSRVLPNGLAEFFSYDDRGRETLHESFEGVITRTSYDDGPGAGGRVLQRSWYKSKELYEDPTKGASEIWSYSYDAFGRVTAVLVTEYSIDNQSTLRTRTYTSFYDVEGRIIRKQSPAGNINYEFDDLGRMIRVFTGNSGSIEEDDSRSELEIVYTYDDHSRLKSVSQHVSGSNHIDSDPSTPDMEPVQAMYAYDFLGRVVEVQFNDAIVEQYDLNQLDQIISVKQFSIGTDTNSIEKRIPISSYQYTYNEIGKRTSLVENIYFDTDSNPSTARIPHTIAYDWIYNGAGRLVEERLDHFDNAFDRISRFRLDLVGNRLEQLIDNPHTSALDRRIISSYDINDRLLREYIHFDGNAVANQTIEHKWLGTQSLSKTSSENHIKSSEQRFSYTLQGQMNRVHLESFAQSGQTIDRRVVRYDYDINGLRESSAISHDAILSTTEIEEVLDSLTRYQWDGANPSLHPQSILQKTYDSDGDLVSVRETVFGLDEVWQRDFKSDSTDDLVLDSQSLFLHDGHGSVRAILDHDSSMQQFFTYVAYGELVSIHGGRGEKVAGIDLRSDLQQSIASQALTDILYAGESFDSHIDQQYLRARWYQPSTGRFERLDPFFGDIQSPQSFHKYGYTHGDPILRADPTGMFEGLAGMLASMTISSGKRGAQGVSQGQAVMAATRMQRFVNLLQRARAILDRIDDVKGLIEDVMDFVELSPSDLLDIANNFRTFDSFSRNLGSIATSGHYYKTQFDLPRNLTKKIRSVTQLIGRSNLLQEVTAEVVMGMMAHMLGFEHTWIRFHSVHGIDQIVRRKSLNVWGILEAKGGISGLASGSRAASYGAEMSHQWITYSLEQTVERSTETSASDLRRSLITNDVMLAAVFKLNVNAKKFDLRIGAQAYIPDRSSSIQRWTGFY